MKLNHLNLTVTDPKATHDFLIAYFGLKSIGSNKEMAFLSDDNGSVISLMSTKITKETEVRYPSAFHIGFIQADEAGVNEIHQRLLDDGYAAPAPSKQHGSWTFYFDAPGGILVEVLC